MVTLLKEWSERLFEKPETKRSADSMRSMYSVESSHALRAATLIAVAIGLAGCGSTSTSGLSDWFPSVPGFSNVVSTPSDRSAMATESAPSMDTDCPTVEVRPGASTLAIAAKPDQPTANDLRYQLTFSQFARQCALAGPVIRMRVGVQGRVIVGPAGVSGPVTVPLRYAVVQEGVSPKTITTKFRRLPMTMPPGALNVTFTDIEEDLSFPLPSAAALESYVVYVGFDDLGDRNERRPPAKKAAPKAK
jgi:hypothetical protein